MTTETKLKANPYLVWCDECGATLCFKCLQYEEAIACEMEACDYADMRFIRRKGRERRKHLATYDHSWIGQDKPLITMRLNV